MITPTVKSISSDELEFGALPPDPADSKILMVAQIGPTDEPGADLFYFVVVTSRALTRMQAPKGGRGYLVIPVFSWGEIETRISQIVLECRGHSWQQVSECLNQALFWEYDGMR